MATTAGWRWLNETGALFFDDIHNQPTQHLLSIRAAQRRRRGDRCGGCHFTNWSEILVVQCECLQWRFDSMYDSAKVTDAHFDEAG